ncbi:MAG: hypothetical protein AAGD28_16215, partial [Bacteroidota bacterium]
EVESIEFHEEDRMWKEFSASYPFGRKRFKFGFWFFLLSLLAFLSFSLFGYYTFEKWLEGPNTKSSTEITQTEKLHTPDHEDAKPVDTMIASKTEVNELERHEEIPSLSATRPNLSNEEAGESKLLLSPTSKGISTLETNPDIVPQTKRGEEQYRLVKSRVLDAELSELNQKIQSEEEIISSDHARIKADIRKMEAVPLRIPTFPQGVYTELPALLLPASPDLSFGQKEGILPEKPHILYLDLYASQGFKNRYQYALGVAYQRSFSPKTAWNIGLGVQASEGLFVSKDSLFITSAISITEYAKHKDLFYLVDSYISGSFSHTLGNIQLSVGGKIKYGLFNQYRIYESVGIRHTDFFGGFDLTTSNSKENNDWDQLNRFRLDAFTEASYNWRQFQIGLTFSRQLNKLINGGSAVALESNRPLHTGIHLRYFFPSTKI